jgi:hypothetical protein
MMSLIKSRQIDRKKSVELSKQLQKEEGNS